MKRVLALAMVVLAPVMIVAIAIIYVASRGLPKDADTALQSYLTHRYDRASMPLIREENLATRPWLFTSEVSGPTFVEGAFYQTTVNFGNLSTGEANWPSTPVAGQGYYSNLNSLRALPYPPEQIWCALTDSKDQGEVPLLVAAHMDMYNAQWIVHEMPAAWTADRVNALLTDLGCAIDWHPSR